MTTHLSNLLLGLGIGAVIAALGMGVVVTHRASNVINFAHAEPFNGASLGPAPVHVAVTLAVLSLVVYGATHRALSAFLPQPATPAPAVAEAAP